MGKEGSWDCDVHNAGTDGVVGFGIVNNDGNPGNIIVRWDGKDTTLEPGYYWRVYTVSPVPNCTHLIQSGKVVFSTKGNYTVRLWGMHPEGETWYYDTEASKTVVVDGAPPDQEWPVTRQLHLFDNVKVEPGIGTWTEKKITITNVDLSTLLGGKLDYVISYNAGILPPIIARIILNDQVVLQSTSWAYGSKTGTVDITGLIKPTNVIKINVTQVMATFSSVAFDMWLTLGYSEEPSEEPGTPFQWEELLKEYWWVAAGGLGLAGIYLLTRKGQPLIVITQPYYPRERKKEEEEYGGGE